MGEGGFVHDTDRSRDRKGAVRAGAVYRSLTVAAPKVVFY